MHLLRMRTPQRDEGFCSSFHVALGAELLRSLTPIRISWDYVLLTANRYTLMHLQILLGINLDFKCHIHVNTDEDQLSCKWPRCNQAQTVGWMFKWMFKWIQQK